MNKLDFKKLGKTFAELKEIDKNTLIYFTRLSDNDIQFLLQSEKYNIDDKILVNGTRYKMIIEMIGNKIVYTLKQGNKILLKQGTRENILNKLSLLYIK